MKTILSILCWALVATFARAGESVTITVENQAVRMVNGKSLSVHDPVWVDLKGTLDDKNAGGITLRQSHHPELLAETRDAKGGLVSTTTRPVPDTLLRIKNFHAPASMKSGQFITCRAVPVGDNDLDKVVGRVPNAPTPAAKSRSLHE